MMTPKVCSVPGCGGPFLAREMCRAHYDREWQAGRLPPRPSAEERFLANVRVDEAGCWLWCGHRVRGYAKFFAGGKSVAAYRWAYEHWIGPIPEGLDLDHYVCHRGADGCANPHHCRPETRSANARNNGHARKTHCKNGHELSGDNVYYPRGGSRRVCRECGRAAGRRWYAERGGIRRRASR